MILPDVNVLVYARRQDHAEHEPARAWLETELSSGRPFALADIVVAGFLRIVTHPRIYERPTPLTGAIAAVDAIRERSNCVPVSPGPRQWSILHDLLERADARGNLVPDAHLGAIAIEHGATVATRDRGFARFPGVAWVDPLA